MSRPPRDSSLSKSRIGERVRGLRAEGGLTQANLAVALGLTQSNVSAMERGERGMTIHQAVKLARILNTTVDELLTGARVEPTTAGRDRYERLVLRKLKKIGALSRRDRQALLKALELLLKGAGIG